jgi:hypothetical protein
MQKIFNNLIGSQVNINGSRYSGKNVRIENGKVYVDGNLVEGGKDDKVINILIEGNVDRLDVDYCNNIVVDGDVNNLESVSGSVKVNTVKGDINTTSGKVEIAGNVEGDVETVSGKVVGQIFNGKVKTLSGDIKTEK